MHYGRTPISSNFNQGMEGARPVLPLNSSCHKVSTVVPFLLHYSGLLPIPGHVIGVRDRRGTAYTVLVPKKHSHSINQLSPVIRTLSDRFHKLCELYNVNCVIVMILNGLKLPL